MQSTSSTFPPPTFETASVTSRPPSLFSEERRNGSDGSSEQHTSFEAIEAVPLDDYFSDAFSYEAPRYHPIDGFARHRPELVKDWDAFVAQQSQDVLSRRCGMALVGCANISFAGRLRSSPLIASALSSSTSAASPPSQLSPVVLLYSSDIDIVLQTILRALSSSPLSTHGISLHYSKRTPSFLATANPPPPPTDGGPTLSSLPLPGASLHQLDVDATGTLGGYLQMGADQHFQDSGRTDTVYSLTNRNRVFVLTNGHVAGTSGTFMQHPSPKELDEIVRSDRGRMSGPRRAEIEQAKILGRTIFSRNDTVPLSVPFDSQADLEIAVKSTSFSDPLPPFSTPFRQTIDWALISVTHPAALHAPNRGDVSASGSLVMRNSAGKVKSGGRLRGGLRVSKYGATTGMTTGEVSDKRFFPVNMNGNLTLEWAVVSTGGGHFVLGGDSGSVVVDRDSPREAVGLLFGGYDGLGIGLVSDLALVGKDILESTGREFLWK